MNDEHDLAGPETPDAQVCPKRLWVLNALSDDMSGEELDALSPGLQFHLSRCSECRSLADGLVGVATGLRSLAAMEQPGSLVAAANGQLFDALKSGGRLTGRTEVRDEPWEEPVRPSVGEFLVRHLRPLAIAASIALFIGVVGWRWSGSLRPQPHSQAPIGPMAGADPSAGEKGESGINVRKLKGQLLERKDIIENSDAEPVEQLADDSQRRKPDAEPERRRTRLPPCGPMDPVDTAFGVDAPCIPRGSLSGPPAERDLGWGRALDNSGPPVFTSPTTKDR